MTDPKTRNCRKCQVLCNGFTCRACFTTNRRGSPSRRRQQSRVKREKRIQAMVEQTLNLTRGNNDKNTAKKFNNGNQVLPMQEANKELEPASLQHSGRSKNLQERVCAVP